MRRNAKDWSNPMYRPVSRPTSQGFMNRHMMRSYWLMRAALASLLIVSCFVVPRTQAQTPPASIQMLADLKPLSEQAMSGVSGMGLITVQQSAPSPASGSIVLWDELRPGQLNTPKSFPGVSVTVNGVLQ
jgi:hypothetical protein